MFHMNNKKLDNLDLFDGASNSTKMEAVDKATISALTSILHKYQVDPRDAETLINAVDTGLVSSRKENRALYWVSVIGLSQRNNAESSDKFSWKKINRKLADHDGVFNKHNSIEDFVALDNLRKVAVELGKVAQFDDLAITAVKLSLLAEGSAEYAKAWIKGLTDESALSELASLNIAPTPAHPVSLYLSTEGETYFPQREKLLEDRAELWSKDALSIASVVKNWTYHEDPLLVSDEDGKRHIGKEPWFQWLKTVDAESMSPQLAKFPEFIEDVNEMMDLEPSTQRILKALAVDSFLKDRTNDESVLDEALQVVEQAEREEKKPSARKNSFNF